jgi:hypothetical protein
VAKFHLIITGYSFEFAVKMRRSFINCNSNKNIVKGVGEEIENNKYKR